MYILSVISGALILGVVAVMIFAVERITIEDETRKISVEILAATWQLSLFGHEYIIYHEERPKEQWLLEYGLLQSLLPLAEEEEEEEKKLIDSISSQSHSVYAVFSGLVDINEKKKELIQKGASTEAIEENDRQERRMASRLMAELQSIFENASLLREKNLSDMRDAQAAAGGLAATTGIVLSLGLIITILASAKNISKSLEKLKKGAEIIGRGNLDYKIEVKSKDETGQLADSFNSMASHLKEITVSKSELEREIEERKKTEIALKESEEKFKNIFNHSRDGILIADIETKKFAMCNNIICKMLGYSEKEIKNLGVQDIHPENDLPYILEQFEKQAKEEIEIAMNLPVKRKDGTIFYADIATAPIMLAGKKYNIGNFRDITERKKAEERLRRDFEAMTRLRKLGMMFVQEGNLEPVLTEIVDAAIALSGADFGNIQLIDPSSGDLRIMAQRGFPGWWLEFWNSVAKGKGSCGTALERGERVIVENVGQSPIFAGTPALEIQLKAGIGAVQSTPLVTRSGRPVGMLSTHWKTPHRPDEQTLQILDLLASQTADIIERSETEEKYLTILKTSIDGFWLSDINGRFLDVNEAYCRIMGYSRDELLKMSIKDIEAVDNFEEINKRIKEIVASGSGHFETKHKTKDGKILDIEISTIYLKESGQFATFIRDITERKKTEKLIKEERIKMQAMLLSIGEGVVAVDKEAKIILANKAFEEMTGWKAEEVIGGKALEIIPQEDEKGNPIPAEERGLWRVLHGEKIAMSLSPATRYYVRKDKTRFPVAFTAAPLIVDEKIIGAVNVFRDISKEQETDRAKTEFVSIVAHQLRTPLASMSLAMEMLLAGSAGKTEKERKKYLKDIYKDVWAMNELVNRLLNISRLEMGTLIVKPGPVNLRNFLNDVLENLLPQIKKKGIKFEKEYGKNLPVVSEIDKNILRNILENIITNSMKYTPEKGKICFKAEKQNGNIVLSVSDNGSGIPEDLKPKIFTKLFRAYDLLAGDEIKGSGIGLYIAKELTERSGGKIWFESPNPQCADEENKGMPAGRHGTAFYVSFPVEGMKRTEPS